MMIFSTGPHIIFNFDASFDKATLARDVMAAQYIGWSTATGAALDMARTQLFENPSSGYRGGDTAVVIVTDGNTLEQPSTFHTAVDNIKALGVTIYSVGVGRNLSYANLNYQASDPADVFLISDFTQLVTQEFAQSTIESMVCSWCYYRDVDLAFILDASGSVNSKWGQIKQFAADFASYMFIGQNDSQ